jgi:hypothetical protein
MTSTGLNNSDIGCFAQGTEGDLAQCVMDGLFAAGPSPGLVGLVMVGTLVTSLYVAGDGDVVVPAVVMILLGAVALQTLPPSFRTLAYTLVVIGGTVAIFTAYLRFTHQTRF